MKHMEVRGSPLVLFLFKQGRTLQWQRARWWKKNQITINSAPCALTGASLWWCLCEDGEVDWWIALHLGRDAEDPLPLLWRSEENLVIGCYLCVTAAGREQRWKRGCVSLLWSVRLHMAQTLSHAPSWTPNTTWCHVLVWARARRSLRLSMLPEISCFSSFCVLNLIWKRKQEREAFGKFFFNFLNTFYAHVMQALHLNGLNNIDNIFHLTLL